MPDHLPPFRVTLDQIEAEAPAQPDHEGRKLAIYSAWCTWWTTDPRDCGAMGAKRWPACPICGSHLFRAPLTDFLRLARQHPDTYGVLGIDALTYAHHRNGYHARGEQGWKLLTAAVARSRTGRA